MNTKTEDVAQENPRIGIFMKCCRKEYSMHQAIRSVLNQTYTNFKFYIVISDETRKIVEEYAEKDDRIYVEDFDDTKSNLIYFKQIAADGNAYVTNIDADDWYDPEYLQELLQFSQKNQTDITACGCWFMNPEGTKKVGERKQKTLVWNREDMADVIPYVYGHFRTVWGKLIKSEVAAQYDLHKLPPVYYGSDTVRMFTLLSYAKKIAVLDKSLYYYRGSTGQNWSVQFDVQRLHCDEILFYFVKDFLESHQRQKRDQAENFLYLVYGNAIYDTMQLVLRQRKLTEKEKIEYCIVILENTLTKKLLEKERKNDLNVLGFGNRIFIERFYSLIFLEQKENIISDSLIQSYYQAYFILYPKWKHDFSFEEFSVLFRQKFLLNIFTEEKFYDLFPLLFKRLKEVNDKDAKTCLKLLRRISANPILRLFLDEKSFALNYQDIFQDIFDGKQENALSHCMSYFSKKYMPKEPLKLIEIWILLASSLQLAAEFILGKQIKAELLFNNERKEEAKAEYEELLELGISDDNMERLKKLFTL